MCGLSVGFSVWGWECRHSEIQHVFLSVWASWRFPDSDFAVRTIFILVWVLSKQKTKKNCLEMRCLLYQMVISGFGFHLISEGRTWEFYHVGPINMGITNVLHHLMQHGVEISCHQFPDIPVKMWVSHACFYEYASFKAIVDKPEYTKVGLLMSW